MHVEEFSGNRTAWTDYLKANGGGVLASWEWGDFKKGHGWKVRRLQVRDGEDVRLVTSVLQKPLPAGFCFFYCPLSPVVKGGDWHDPKNQAAFEALADYLKADAKPERALFLKVDPHVAEADFPLDWLTNLGFKDSVEDVQAPFVVHVDLRPTTEEIFAAMKQKGRYNIRSAQKKGVEVKAGSTEADLDIFYKLHQATAARQGITYRAKDYFSEMRQRLMVDAGHATFLTGWHEGEPVASIIVTFLGEESIYLYGGNSLDDRTTNASYLVQWEGIQLAKQRGCTFYNMTGVAPTDDPDDAWAGLRQFKLKFGGEIVALLGARDQVYKPLRYTAFTQADRVRRKLAKRSGL